MRLTDLLTADRVAIEHRHGGTDAPQTTPQAETPADADFDKEKALRVLSRMLAQGAATSGVGPQEVERVLLEREGLQSTGIGDGVAIPHGALPQLETQCASLLIVPEGIDFSAIDGMHVNILFAVIGPKRATGEHLKTLARVSRLLRNKEFRDRLVHASDAKAAYALIDSEEGERR
jgi:PTS system nitrogen regulatory IIA component